MKPESPMDIRHTSSKISAIFKIGTKTLLLMFLFLIAFLLENIVLPEQLIILEDTLPASNVIFKLQNRVLVIVFFLLLILITRKKYLYLFKLDPLKRKETYIWVMGILIFQFTMEGFNLAGSFALFPFSFSEYLQLLIIVALIAPLEEELLYRGLLLLVPSQKIRYLMLIISAVAFALIHSIPINALWLGLGTGFLAIRFNNLLVPLIVHSLWNIFVTFYHF
jgi:membrane protease YdiL (CAAX protease family)